jgi:hypothetical protein
MPAIVNSSNSGDLAPGLDGSGAPVATAIAVVRTTSLSVTVGGTTLTSVMSAQVTYGFDQVAGEARVVCAVSAGSVGDTVTIVMGCTPGTITQRFQGTLMSIDTTLAPHSVSLMAKGPLYAIEEYQNGTETIFTGDGLGRPGLAFGDLVGTNAGATLKQIVSAVLNIAGAPALNGGSDDPSHIYGLVADEEFTWGTYETAAGYINKVCQASAGYRVFDSADGNVFLKQISAIPAAATTTFTLGVDIFGNTQSSTSRIGQRTSALVEGYDFAGTGPFTSNLGGTPVGTSVFHLSSPLIESDAFASELAAFWLSQVNRRQETISLTTPRDNLLGPGESHAIAGVTPDTMWVKSVTVEITSNGQWSQRLTYVAAG